MIKNEEVSLLKYIPYIQYYCVDKFYYLENKEKETLPYSCCSTLTELSKLTGKTLSCLSKGFSQNTKIYYQGEPWAVKKDAVSEETKKDFFEDIYKAIYEESGIDIKQLFPKIKTPQKLYKKLSTIKRGLKK